MLKKFLNYFGVLILFIISFFFFKDIHAQTINLLDYAILDSNTVFYVEEGQDIPVEKNENFSKRSSTEQYFNISGHEEQKIYAIPKFSPINLGKELIYATSSLIDFNQKFPVKPLQNIDILSWLGIQSAYASSTLILGNQSGSVYANSGSYTTARDATSGTLVNNTYYIGNELSGGTYYVYRSMFNFIGTTTPSEISTASVWFQNGLNNLDTQNDSIGVFGGSFSNPLVAGDFDLVNSTAYSSYLDITTAITNAWAEIPLNSVGTSSIGSTSTKMSLRFKQDIDSTQPTGRNVIQSGGVFLYIIYKTVSCPEPETIYATTSCFTTSDDLDDDAMSAYLNFWWKWPFILGIIMLAWKFLVWFKNKITQPSI